MLKGLAGVSLRTAPVVLRQLQVPVKYPVRARALVCRPLSPIGSRTAKFWDARMVLQQRVRKLHTGEESDQCLCDQLRQWERERLHSGSKRHRIFIDLS